MRAFSTDSPEAYVPPGMSAIIGFQQVLSNPDKVFVWFRQEVERPIEVDRHRTTREANNSGKRTEWGKSVWLKSKVWEHFEYTLTDRGITKEKLMTFQDDPDCDVWVTKGDGTRKFLQCYMLNPESEFTGAKVNIQVTQSKGKAPADIYRRAQDESMGNPEVYQQLLAKYKDKAMLKSYSPYVDEKGGIVSKKLTPVYVEKNGLKLPIYEESEIVLGRPVHKFVHYERHEHIPIDVIEFTDKRSSTELSGEAVIVRSLIPEEQQLTLFD